MKENVSSALSTITNTVVDHTLLVLTVVTVGGAVKLFTYYKCFNLLVFPFLDIGEIITLFASNLIPFIAVTLLLGVVAVVYHTLSSVWLKVVPAIFYTGAVVLGALSPHIYYYETVGHILGFTLLYAITIYVLKGLDSNRLDPVMAGGIVISGLCGLIVAGGVLFALNEAYKVKAKMYYVDVDVYVEGEKLVNDTCNYYIGKTNGYVFYYHCAIQVSSPGTDPPDNWEDSTRGCQCPSGETPSASTPEPGDRVTCICYTEAIPIDRVDKIEFRYPDRS